MGVLYLGNHFIVNGFILDLNIVNLIFLSFALLLYGNVKELGNGLLRASSSVGQFALQYPFYAGIMGMMTASGLAIWLSTFFADIATNETLPLFTFFCERYFEYVCSVWRRTVGNSGTDLSSSGC